MSVQFSRNFIIKITACAALVVFVVWIARNTYWTEITVPSLLRGEAATNPFYTAQHLSDALGAHSEWRHVLGAMPSSKAVIVLTDWDWGVIAGRRSRLEQWVNAGGRLVLDESLIGGDEALRNWAGIERVSTVRKPTNKKTDDANEPERDIDINALIELAKTGNCSQLQVVKHEPGVSIERSSYQLCNINNSQHLNSNRPMAWALRDRHGIQALRIDIGQGSVTKINAMPFGNREMFNADHALLFVAATQLQRGDEIYFLLEEERAPLIALIWRYGAPVVVLAVFAIALALWRSGVRFGPLSARADGARRSLAEQIRGSGRFVLQFGGGRALHAAMLRALHETATKQVLRYERLSSEERIATLATRSGIRVEDLTEAINYTGPRRATELRDAIALLERARRRLLDKRTE